MKTLRKLAHVIYRFFQSCKNWKLKIFDRKMLIFFLYVDIFLINVDIFLIFAQNIDCGYTLEPPRRGGSNEYPQSMFWSKNKKRKAAVRSLLLLCFH